MTETIRSFIPDLPRRAWVVLAGDAVSTIGTGLVMPFFIVYLNEVRGLSLGVAGLVVATTAAVSIVVAPVAGWLVDHFGPRRTLLAALGISAASSIAIAFIRTPWQAFVAAALFGTGIAALWPAIHSTLISLVSVEQRSSVFAAHYATMNAGFGIGGIAGGLVANVARPTTFEVMYTVDALSFVAFGLLLLKLKDVGVVSRSEGVAGAGTRGYREVLKDRVFLRLIALTTLLVVIGYSQLESGFPAFARDSGVSTRAIGFAFALNTVTIVIAQLVVLKHMKGRRRTRGIAALCLLWACAWTVTVVAGSSSSDVLTTAGFVVAMVVFALGETLVSTSIPPMVNDLAPDELRGRYNASYALAFSIGHVAGPAAAGFAVGGGLGSAFFGVLIASCLAAAFAALRLERRLPATANVGRAEEEMPAEADAYTPAGEPLGVEVI
jgi:MFS family permease